MLLCEPLDGAGNLFLAVRLCTAGGPDHEPFL
jgi:hypothetical protein